MKISEMPILHSALTSVACQDKIPNVSSETVKVSEESDVEANESELENEGEVITIYISPSESNDASSVEQDESTQTVSSSENDTASEATVEDPPKRGRVLHERCVGNVAGIVSAGEIKMRLSTAKARADLQKKKIKSLQQKNRRLRNRIVRMKAVLRHLQSQKAPGNNAR